MKSMKYGERINVITELKKFYGIQDYAKSFLKEYIEFFNAGYVSDLNY